MKKVFTLVVVALLSLILFSQGVDINLAYKYFNDQEYEKAGTLFHQLYQTQKARHYLHYYVRCLMESDKSEEAIKILRKAIREEGDVTLNIDLGWVYESSGDSRSAEACFELPLKKFPQTLSGIQSLGSSYMTYLKYQYAQTVYETGRALLGTPGEFSMELANVFATQRRYPEMIREYFNLILTDPRYVKTVENLLLNAKASDIDGNLMTLVKAKTYESIQQFPGLPAFVDILVWVFTQEGKYDEAVDQVIALDKRFRENGERVLEIAREARQNLAFTASIRAYEYLEKKAPAETINQDPRNIITRVPPNRQAGIELLLTKTEYLEQLPNPAQSEFAKLEIQLSGKMDELNMEMDVASLILPLAKIRAYHLNQTDSALAAIDRGLQMQGLPPVFYAQFQLEKGDILLASGDPWEATFLYARVDKENPTNNYGTEAKYKKARLAYLTGDFRWALAQLEPLKASTSKPVANDAMELSLFIRYNQSEGDSAKELLTVFSRIDYLILQRKRVEALTLLDSVISAHPGHPVLDDCLYKKAELLLSYNRMGEVTDLLKLIVDGFKIDGYGARSLFRLGEIYLDFYHDPVQAENYFQEILDYFPNSFYFIDARNRIKEIRDSGKDPGK